MAEIIIHCGVVFFVCTQGRTGNCVLDQDVSEGRLHAFYKITVVTAVLGVR